MNHWHGHWVFTYSNNLRKWKWSNVTIVLKAGFCLLKNIYCLGSIIMFSQVLFSLRNLYIVQKVSKHFILFLNMLWPKKKYHFSTENKKDISINMQLRLLLWSGIYTRPNCYHSFTIIWSDLCFNWGMIHYILWTFFYYWQMLLISMLG
jgi:hypothetical protein